MKIMLAGIFLLTTFCSFAETRLNSLIGETVDLTFTQDQTVSFYRTGYGWIYETNDQFDISCNLQTIGNVNKKIEFKKGEKISLTVLATPATFIPTVTLFTADHPEISEVFCSQRTRGAFTGLRCAFPGQQYQEGLAALPCILTGHKTWKGYEETDAYMLVEDFPAYSKTSFTLNLSQN